MKRLQKEKELTLTEDGSFFLKLMDIDFKKCICYNANRQKEVIKVQYKAKALSTGNTGGFFLCFYGALT